MHMPHKQNMIGSVRGLRSPPHPYPRKLSLGYSGLSSLQILNIGLQLGQLIGFHGAMRVDFQRR